MTKTGIDSFVWSGSRRHGHCSYAGPMRYRRQVPSPPDPLPYIYIYAAQTKQNKTKQNNWQNAWACCTTHDKVWWTSPPRGPPEGGESGVPSTPTQEPPMNLRYVPWMSHFSKTFPIWAAFQPEPPLVFRLPFPQGVWEIRKLYRVIRAPNRAPHPSQIMACTRVGVQAQPFHSQGPQVSQAFHQRSSSAFHHIFSASWGSLRLITPPPLGPVQRTPCAASPGQKPLLPTPLCEIMVLSNAEPLVNPGCFTLRHCLATRRADGGTLLVVAQVGGGLQIGGGEPLPGPFGGSARASVNGAHVNTPTLSSPPPAPK